MLIRTSLLALDQAARLQFNVGDGLDLWLDDRRLGARQDDRDISLRLTGDDVPADLVQVHLRGQIGSVPIDLSFDPTPNLFFNHVWDGTSGEPDAPGTPSNLVTELSIGWEMAAAFPRPERIKWWREPIVVGGIDLRGLGCGGITPDAVHHYDVGSDILWRGNGSRLTKARENSPRHLSRLKISSKEIGIADGEFVHVFAARGSFKRTLSTLKGHEVASARTDETGQVTSWTHSGHRYTIDRRNDSEALLRSPAGVWAVIDFDDRGRAVMVTDQDKSQATLEYTPTGGLSRVVDSAGLITEIDRDELGRVIQFRDSTGRQLDLTRTQFDGGNEVTVVTAEGRETRHRSERLEDGSYVESHACCGAASPRVIGYFSLGPLGDERIVRSPEGVVATVRRSARSDKLREVEVARTSISSPAGLTLSSERRVERHRTGRTHEQLIVGGATSSKRLDPKTHSTVSHNAEGHTSVSKLVPGEALRISAPGIGELKIEFDANGRPRRRDRLGEIMTYGYDQNGRLTWADFERWRQHIHHDEQGRVNAIETPDGWMQIARDAAGRVVGLKAPHGGVTSVGRRPDGAISSISYPETEAIDGGVPDSVPEVEQMLYDRDGLLVGHLFNGDTLVAYERNAAGRVSAISAGDVQITATYDAASGQLVEMASATGDALRLHYDGVLETAAVATGAGRGSIERSFDDNHRVVSHRVNGAHELRVSRDGDGRVTGVGPLQIERSSNAGLPVAIRLGGLTTTRTFDDVGRVTRHATSLGKIAGTFFGEEIERDDFGRVVRIVETTPGRTREITYTYNEARRLESVTVDGRQTMSLAYDSNGNITSLDRLGRTLVLESDAADRLVRLAGQPTTHDYRGNLTGIGPDGAVRSYRFDGLGRMVGSQDAHHDVTHTLDPLGRPVVIRGAGAPIRLVWDGDRVAATVDSAGNVETRFIDSGTTACPEGLIRNGVEYLLVTDHLGSVRAVVDSHEGTVAQLLDYDALGRPIVNTAPGWQPFGFAGGLHETVGGLVRFQARTYDPFTGRFLARDPLGFAGGQVNLYQYALGDPINNVDPTGLLVGPSGEIHACRDDFIGKRPLSADHTYLRSDTWGADMRPLTTLGEVGDLLSTWTRGASSELSACSLLAEADQVCTSGGMADEVAAGWGQTDLCASPGWSLLDTAANPAAWEFDPVAWDEGPGPKQALQNVSRLGPRIRQLRSQASARLSVFADSLFD